MDFDIGQEEFSEVQVIQRKALIQGCLLHTGINTAIQDILLSQDQAKDIVVKDAQKAIVTATSIWACYLATNIPLLTKCCSGALSTRRQAHVRVFADEEAESLMIALSKLLSVIMSLKPFTPANDRPLPATLALAEDYTLLGLLPLEGFHKSVDFLKEAKHDAPATTDGRTEVRWYRIYDLCQRLVESGVSDRKEVIGRGCIILKANCKIGLDLSTGIWIHIVRRKGTKVYHL